MKNRLVFASWLFAVGVLTAQASLVEENFQSGYTAGDLSGQNSWEQGFGVSPTPSASVVLASGNYYVSSVDNVYSIKDAGNYGLTAADTITLTYDLYVSAAGVNAAFGIGNYNSTSTSLGTPAVFGVVSGSWSIRGWGFGATAVARNTSNIAIAPTVDKWYRVQSVWDLSGTGAGTLSIMNLTDGQTAYTQLFFDAAQTVATADLGLGNANNPGVENWEGVFLRTSNAGVDNISVIPEPATIGMLALGSVLVMVVRRSSRQV